MYLVFFYSFIVLGYTFDLSPIFVFLIYSASYFILGADFSQAINSVEYFIQSLCYKNNIVIFNQTEYMLLASGLTVIPKSSNRLASYLAGLIEGDGSIIVPGEGTKSYRPYFEIVFHIQDLTLALILQSLLGGNILFKENYCVLIIKKKSSVLNIINLLNGHMRTPKIEALHRMIEWFNTHDKCEIKPVQRRRSRY